MYETYFSQEIFDVLVPEYLEYLDVLSDKNS